MAQKTIVSLVDDLDSGEADETVSLGLDGATYTIDLSEKNALVLREALAPFVATARRTGGRVARRPAGSTRAASTGAASIRAASNGAAPTAAGSTATEGTASRRSVSREDTAAVREWARANGHQVSGRGRIASSVLEEFRKAH